MGALNQRVVPLNKRGSCGTNSSSMQAAAYEGGAAVSEPMSAPPSSTRLSPSQNGASKPSSTELPPMAKTHGAVSPRVDDTSSLEA
eukprot:CAMPEP_0115879596 /NCGR_PEP_ID=MMETSP0287-20121206/27408_1 /TAXON_ID=412157 /ORGANISM="Chrysochromulina rotalis, Strain UIO044" /LENGTH=85 /DNA_ID=CAMNT_0003335323 /DNA_START=8 /DNA_END=265 /DNA_ORIENTATION=-